MSSVRTSQKRQKRLFTNPQRFDYSPFVNDDSSAPFEVTELGALWSGDCLDILPTIKSDSIDVVFADPPFNLGKEYGAKSNDRRPDYLEWCKSWLDECHRVLKPGGSLFVYNLPKWNITIGNHLDELGMNFRHWIAIEMNACLPIPGRLYPCHYSLLYYSKGKPKTFRKIRTPIATCRHCGKELKDYGGHRSAMNPNGVNLKDIWLDIPPVRHQKYKSKDRRANALSTKILDRVIEMSSQVGDVVLDPFGGSGTTFAVCEHRGRHWLGIELDFAEVIRDRLRSDEVKLHRNDDFVEN